MSRFIILMACIALLSGCAIFNPYQEEFACPAVYKGKCISVKGAYAESKNGTDGGVNDPKITPCSDDEADAGKCSSFTNSKKAVAKGGEPEEDSTVEVRNYNAYKASLYQRFNNLIREPQMPVVVPPKTMRVLLLPYKGQDGEFYMLRHVYFFVDEPRWMLGDSVESLEIDE